MKNYMQVDKNYKITLLEWVKEKSLFLVVIGILFALLVKDKVTLSPLDAPPSIPFSEQIEETSLEQTSSSEEAEAIADLYVDLKGWVRRPGVYRLSPGSRLMDLIEDAGGLLEGAAEDQLNMASLLEDQMVVRVYSVDEVRQALEQSGADDLSSSFLLSECSSSNSGNEENELVNINTADQATLETLPNIGPAKAAKIITYRQQEGSFSKIEQLMEVSGIGSKTFESLKDQITVGP